jgi:hypothetical protein
MVVDKQVVAETLGNLPTEQQLFDDKYTLNLLVGLMHILVGHLN